VLTLTLNKKQAAAILFAMEEEYDIYGKLDKDARIVARKVFKLYPELKDGYSLLAWEVFPEGKAVAK
jgi:hypothetical protein